MISSAGSTDAAPDAWCNLLGSTEAASPEPKTQLYPASTAELLLLLKSTTLFPLTEFARESRVQQPLRVHAFCQVVSTNSPGPSAAFDDGFALLACWRPGPSSYGPSPAFFQNLSPVLRLVTTHQNRLLLHLQTLPDGVLNLRHTPLLSPLPACQLRSDTGGSVVCHQTSKAYETRSC
ncbi:hypothetical protein BDW02DRAFT_93054 [Decorospora gaudefroyi]|uniref:Uncharacterized protein n=1 Tax=Decorospora gaudefroyi TaxID=184978 RepID=A0A6A5JZG1_9PLEO|nr:hypothetical protein BDW02DRAFT_93054 [Decorospora gaudefroyi]